MAVPKAKTSSSRRDKRRSSTWKLKAPTMAKCPNCGEYNLAYRACSKCFMYDGETVKQVKEKKADAE